MSRLPRFFALVLLAVWLPATLHCRAETAGLLDFYAACETEKSPAVGTDCDDTICPTVETALFKESAADLLLVAPALHDCAFGVAWRPVRGGDCAEPALSPARHSPPPSLAAGWQFLIRAAPQPGAPALNA